MAVEMGFKNLCFKGFFTKIFLKTLNVQILGFLKRKLLTIQILDSQSQHKIVAFSLAMLCTWL